MKTVIIIGRWQCPTGPHLGHRYLVDMAIEEGHRVVIGMRDIPGSTSDPMDVETRSAHFRRLYGDKIAGFITIPEDGDGLSLWQGREVGWDVEIIDVPETVAKVSATAARNLQCKTILFTGMPCSGKTTLAGAFKPILESYGYSVIHLDGDETRQGLCAGLGFSTEERAENLRRVASVCQMLNQDNIIALASYVSPTDELRAAFDVVENLDTIWVHADQEDCIKRDVKGMWAKAQAGVIPEFTGWSAPYDPPLNPHLVLDCSGNSVAVDRIMDLKRYYGLTL